ncbi:tyrosinase family protein [Kitasatospora sp. NPDC058965]|uniref:tyrosinase family protein n=1 Tax=Kitasatospora sp. NPDC058965 TaxID=3346682 RepID=UPI0036BB63DB
MVAEVSRRRFFAWAGAGVAVAAAFRAPNPASAAVTVRIRPEVKTLKAIEWDAYVNAVKALHRASDDRYSRLVLEQYNNVTRGHGVPAYFPWHREYLHRFQQELHLINPQVTVPYWDWTRDAAAPQDSVVLGNSMFGGKGAPKTGCVTTGQFANWQATVPTEHCLIRTTDPSIGPLCSSKTVESVLTHSASYDHLRQAVEGQVSSSFHTAIGGLHGDMSYMYSPNDPLYWSHIAFMDLLWAEWQARNPALAHTYDGGNGVSPSDNLLPFNVRVSDTFDTRSIRYSYAYPRWSGAA